MHYCEAKGLLSQYNGMNIYRGCTHGCIYCDSRSKCYQINHDFEDIEVKQNAPELLEKALRCKRNPCMIGTGSMCDPYMHCEEQLKLTRRCLEIIDRYGFGVTIQTKSTRFLRDMDLLKSINHKAKAVVQMTLTTSNEDLCKIVEPNVSTTYDRFLALQECADNGIPTVVWLSPLLPFINDTRENVEGIMDYCIRAKVKGIIFFGIGVTLRDGDREYFYKALDRNFPGVKERYKARYGTQYEVKSDRDAELTPIVQKLCRDNGIMYQMDEVFSYLHEFPNRYEQLSLF